jgi:hypothetical protein
MSSAILTPEMFKKITDDQERSSLLQDLVNSRAELQVKLPNPIDVVLSLKAHEVEDFVLKCALKSSPAKMTDNGDLVISFFLGAEKYFSSAKFTASNDQIDIFVDGPIFQLQRREDFRLKIPNDQTILFQCTEWNGTSAKQSVPLRDLSAGGCRIMIDPKKWNPKPDDLVAGFLFIPNRDPVPVGGSIKYFREESTDKSKQTAGIQFTKLSEPQKNKIAAIVMDLFRVFFARMK